MGIPNRQVHHPPLRPMVENHNSQTERQQAISTFRAATSIQTDDEALHFLEAAAWDLDRAASLYLDAPHSSESGTRNGQASPTPPPPAPPSSPPTPARTSRRWLVILFSPLRFVWTFLSNLTSTIFRLLSGPAAQIEAAPGETPSRRFLNFFEERYGTSHPRFFDGPYLTALSHAHTQLKFVLIYVHSESHRLTPAFVRDILTHPALINATGDLVVWAGSITQSDGAAAHHALRASSLPFLAVVAAPTRTSTDLTRADFGTVLGMRSGAACVAAGGEAAALWLLRVVNQNRGFLDGARAQRVERESARLLREQQDEEYAAALEADRQRERERAETEAKEEGEKRRAEEREVRRERKRVTMGTEPDKGPGVASVVLRLPNGNRVGRRFAKSDCLECVFDWAEVNCVDIEVACLVVAFPRRVFRYPEDAHLSVEQAGLFPSCMLLLEERA